MKKLSLILGLSLVLASCGEDQQSKVCECSKLYDSFSAKGDEADAAGGDWTDAYKAASEASGEAGKSCETFHAEIGDKTFAEMSKNCK